MADFSLQKLKSTLTGGGARTNLWEIVFPQGFGTISADVQVLARTASLPATTLNAISINYRGRQIHFPGDQSAANDWNVTVINDTNFNIRRAFETWISKVSNYKSWKGEKYSYAQGLNVEVYQLDRDGERKYGYKFYNLWPTTISEIALTQDAGAIEEFQVTFKVDYFTPIQDGKNGELA